MEEKQSFLILWTIFASELSYSSFQETWNWIHSIFYCYVPYFYFYFRYFYFYVRYFCYYLQYFCYYLRPFANHIKMQVLLFPLYFASRNVIFWDSLLRSALISDAILIFGYVIFDDIIIWMQGCFKLGLLDETSLYKNVLDESYTIRTNFLLTRRRRFEIRSLWLTKQEKAPTQIKHSK